MLSPTALNTHHRSEKWLKNLKNEKKKASHRDWLDWHH
ncbi:hypothetical protein VVMO6_04232 [Vibrio vulnificus MO6-24/O]|nr:hypothetical protein VVMO6_04232 [Vibrio vulnificus MO6-24/O]